MTLCCMISDQFVVPKEGNIEDKGRARKNGGFRFSNAFVKSNLNKNSYIYLSVQGFEMKHTLVVNYYS